MDPKAVAPGYVLLEDADGKADSKKFLFRTKTEDVVLLRGDLCKAEPSRKQPQNDEYLAVKSITHPRGGLAVVPKQHLAPLSEKELLLLHTIPHAAGRISAYEDGRLREAELLAVHSKVIVTSLEYPDPTPGVIWFVGQVESISPGIVFGVELLADPPKGHLDGTFHGHRYFSCPAECGVFVTFDKLRVPHSDEEFEREVSAICTHSDKPSVRLKHIQEEIDQQWVFTLPKVKKSIPETIVQMRETPDGRLKLGMPVVVFQDNGLQFKGYVRWLGNASIPIATQKSSKKRKMKTVVHKSESLVAGLEIILSTPEFKAVFLVQGTKVQKHAYFEFETQSGGIKIYLPAEAVLPLDDYHQSKTDAEPKQQAPKLLTRGRQVGSAMAGLQHSPHLEQQWMEERTTITEERDQLLRENSWLHNAYQTATDTYSNTIEQLNGQLNQVSAERDHLEKQLADERMENVALIDQFQDDRRRRSCQLTELRQQLAVAQQTTGSVELDRLRRRCSTLEKAYQSSQAQLEHLHDSANIPADDVYLSETKLGEGSYGVVTKGMWRGIPVAIKRFHDVLQREALQVSDYYKKLFRQELSTCAKLQHPNIVTFCGATLEKDTPLQIVMEILEGSLEELIKVAKDSGFYLTLREQVHLAEGTTAGITYLHQLQPTPYVHCDIRPSNILVSRDMSAKVGDLGASHIVGASTSAGPLSGNYIAPERIGDEGQRSQSSPSSDVYSLGVTLTDLFTGEAAVPSKRDEQLAVIANYDLQDLCIEATLAIPRERPAAAHMLVRLQQQKSTDEFLRCPVRRLVLGKVEGDTIRLTTTQ